MKRQLHSTAAGLVAAIICSGSTVLCGSSQDKYNREVLAHNKTKQELTETNRLIKETEQALEKERQKNAALWNTDAGTIRKKILEEKAKINSTLTPFFAVGCCAGMIPGIVFGAGVIGLIKK